MRVQTKWLLPLSHGQPQLPINEDFSTNDLAYVSWERSYPPACPLLSVVISTGADGGALRVLG